MGIKLKNLYDEVGREKGPVGRMQLAMLTKITSFEALDCEDSPQNLKVVEDAIAQLRRQP
jgi:hypothetical protein